MKILVAIAILSLLGSPLGGLHMHLSGEKGFAGLHTVHVHEEGKHAAESDSSIAELSFLLFQVLIAAVGIAFILVLRFSREREYIGAGYQSPPVRRVFLNALRLRAPPHIR